MRTLMEAKGKAETKTETEDKAVGGQGKAVGRERPHCVHCFVLCPPVYPLPSGPGSFVGNRFPKPAAGNPPPGRLDAVRMTRGASNGRTSGQVHT